MASVHRSWWSLVYRMAIVYFWLKSGIQAEEIRQQYFRIQPKSIRAQEGSEVSLQCEIEFLRGRVQWTKDGYALGYDPVILGFSRYRMVGDGNNGVYDLQIRNVSLEDDAEYECQVGPYRPAGLKPIEAIRASANLTVLSPPASIELTGRAPGSELLVSENQELKLECHVHKSKPPARIVWYRASNELKLSNREDRVIVSKETGNPRTTLYDVVSSIHLVPTAEDDGVKYTCEAQHEALPDDMTLKTSVQLSVSYPPGDPYIDGYDPKRDTIRRGQTVELICRSRGGNPLAQLVWYRNGEEVRAVSTVTGKFGRTSQNILSFVADTKDNNARYTCKASSVVGPTQKKVETTLTVNYAPLHVTIVGTKEAKVQDIVELNCTSGPSNPAASIRWLIDGREVYHNSSRITADPENGWLTSSTIQVSILPEKTNIVVICQGVNNVLKENVVTTHTINVLYPPTELVISGYHSGTYVDAGTVQRLICKSSGGNPLATLTWFKNDRKINSVTKTDKSLVYSEIQILVNATDNEAVYKCEAINPAIDIPMFQLVKFNVYFPPENVVIRKEPPEFRAGTIGKFICDASSSNPEANLTFWREGIEIESVNKKSKPGLHGGNVTSIVVKVNVTADMDGNLFTCQAQNPKLGRHVHHEIRLAVMYKPIFTELNETTFTGVENENMLISLEANGHPAIITFTWGKNGIPLPPRGPNYIIDGSTLNFTRLNRTDSGAYSCEAINSEGSTMMNFTINVQYSANISGISDVVLVNENDDAELWCTIDAVPLSSEHVTWRRPGFPLESRTMTSYKNNTFYLVVRGITRKDMGQFFCVADNGIGNEVSQPAYLVVKHEPEIDKSPVLLKAAARIGDTARLICRASGAPKLVFAWSQNGLTISVNTTAKYHTNFHQLDAITYESILSINKIDEKDYGQYQCKASNALGFRITTITLSLPSKPDPPLTVRIVNATHDAVTIAWIPGFDGGEPAKFRVYYRDSSASTSSFKYSEADHNTVHTITGLQLGTTYLLNVKAYNNFGENDVVNNMLKASTSNLPAEALLNNVEFPLLFIFSIAAVAILLLLINICILAAFFYKRKKFQGINEQSSNKSGTIEMYAPSSFNETMTGETLSSVSEKSETYSDSRQDYDEKKRNGVNAYMIEQIDYPFQYPGYDTHPKEHVNIEDHRNLYVNHNGTGYQSENSSRYSSSADPRYVTYPPPVQFAQPTLTSNNTLRRGAVPPPDVTVLTAAPPVSMTTFNYSGSETEGHLV